MSQAEQYGVDRESETYVSPAAVEEQLQRILASDLFLNAHRLSNFLRFSVERVLRGEGEQIKEYLIGTEVFGRSSSYDPRTDPVVRVEAGRLRLKLTEYYRTQGQSDPVIIDLPKGTYAPAFLHRSSRLETEQSKLGLANLGWGGRVWAAALAAIAVTAAVSAYYFHARNRAASFPASVAVLPFLNLTGSSENDYLSDGFTEELTTALSEVQGLRVVARTSAFQFRGKSEDVRRIGEQLNVGAVLEGSVSRSDDELHVTAQLISTQNGYHLWTGTYDGEHSEIYAIEKQIVRQTIRRLGIAATGQERTSANRRTENPEAHDLYLEGRYYWNKRDLPDMERSVQLFKAAIQKDPKFALAYAGLADTYVIIGGNGQKPLSEVVPRAKAALTRALELDPNLGEAHATLALLHSEISGERRGLEPELRRAVELSPGYPSAHHWLGLILSTEGHFEEADAELRKAQILDPLSPMITEGVAENFYHWRRYDDAIEQVRRMHQMGSGLGDYVLGRAYVEKAMYQDAVAVFSALRKGDRASLALTNLAIAYAAAGKKAEARSLLREATTLRDGYIPPYWIGVAYLYLGEKDNAFQWLQKAYRQNDPMLGNMKVDPMLDPIRSDRRYVELLGKADLSD
jgi:TolB-like protein/tetratricopeptide (TPR) repeat protein